MINSMLIYLIHFGFENRDHV